MSTRANIIIKDQYDKLFFYRHSDGYPEVTMPTLEKFLSHVEEGDIRDNVGQAAGWLILIGAEEYIQYKNEGADVFDPSTDTSMNNWKVGAYEPTTGLHGDIEYLYIVDLDEKTIDIIEDYRQFDKYA